MTNLTNDRERLRQLAREYMDVAALPVHTEKRELWRRLNRLDPVRPMVWINELPWEEMQDDDLALHCEDDFCRRLEKSLRTTLYLWRRMPTDMVVDPVLYGGRVYHDTGFGIEGKRVAGGSNEYGRGAYDYVPIMRTEADVERIQTPRVTADPAAAARNLERMNELVGDIVPVQERGVTHMWFSPWDVLIQWWGIEELYVDMTDRPDFVHRGVARIVDAHLARLDQLEAQGLLSAGDYNHRVGSGGLGITDELPQPDCDPARARPLDQWGTATGQIFSAVSPAMHWEFCLQHELRWLERFGLNCYGCCEPLHNKMGILRRIPRLRRISMSRWIDVDKAAAELGRDFIFSYKPNPAVFAWDDWNPDAAREELRDVLAKTHGCVVELIMKDVTTCRRDPPRVWDWCRLAVETAEEFAY